MVDVAASISCILHYHGIHAHTILKDTPILLLCRLFSLLQEAEIDSTLMEDWHRAAHSLHLASILYDATQQSEARDRCAAACLKIRENRSVTSAKK
jgi:hypothetical protein